MQTPTPLVTNATSQRVEKADVEIVYKDDGKEERPLEAQLLKDIRQMVGDRLNEYAQVENVQSIKVNFHVEDN